MPGEAHRLSRERATLLLVPLFLLSGAASLVYETLWARQLHVLFGTSQLAITTVLAAFMGGLALGSFAAARWAERTARPLLGYAILEAFIGFYALIFPFLLRAVSPLYLGLWRAVEPGPAAFGTFQFVLLGVLLLPPTLCMGATLPLLARFVTSERAETGYQVGRLYGVNTLGAVLGTALAGFVLLPRLGLAATTWGTAAVNLVLALLAVALSRASEPIPAAEVAHAPAGAKAKGGEDYRPLLIVAALAGFASLLCEVAWFRLLSLTLGGSAYAFTIMLLAFLLGIGIGGWVGGRLADRDLARGGRKLVLGRLAGIQFAVGILCWSAMFAYGQLPFAFVWLFDRVGGSGALFWVAQVGLALAIMILPTLLMGATFPYLVRAAAGRPDRVSSPVGRLYGTNTIGALIGASLAGLVLLPALNIRGTVVAAASVNILAAVLVSAAAVATAGRVRDARFAAKMAGGAALIILMFLFRPPWNPLLMTSGMYQYVDDLEDRSRTGLIDSAVTPFELLHYDEGLSSVVAVARTRGSGNIWLSVNGKVDASTEADLETQVLLAHLPIVVRPDADNVLVIGFASGMTTGSIALYDSPTRIDAAEIEPAVIEASHYFDEHNNRPLDDPRVRVILNDARNHLMLVPDGTYDLVSSEPSNPWLSGVSNLFTRDFFELGKRKMSPGGVWAQWVQTYAMTPSNLKSVFASFADVFGFVAVFRIDDADLVILGSDAPLPFSADSIAEVVQRSPDAGMDLARLGMRKSEEIVALYLFGEEELRTLVGDVVRNTDDNMRVEYEAPLHLFEETRIQNIEMLMEAAVVPLNAIDGPEELKILAEAYSNYDWDLRRAIAAMAVGQELYPDDPEFVELLEEFTNDAD
jgi:spermidine synthase